MDHPPPARRGNPAGDADRASGGRLGHRGKPDPSHGSDRTFGRGPDHGAVTVETAVIMPALILLLAVLLAAAAAGTTTVRFEEAARASARAAARGEDTAAVEGAARSVAGNDAAVQVFAGGNRVTVSVSGPAPGVLGQWSSWRLHAEATAAVENHGSDSAGP